MSGLAVVAVVWCVALGGCEKVPVAGAGSVEVEVGVTEVAVRTVEVSIEQVGRLRPRDAVDVRSRVAGFVVERAFEEGAKVKAGQVLYRIDPAPFRADLAVAQAKLEQARAVAGRAEREARRLATLFEQQATSEKELADAKTAMLESQASVKLAEAEKIKAELDLSYTEVKAPFDGVAGEAVVAVGALVDAGANSLLTRVIAADPIQVTLGLSEQEGLLLGKGIRDGEVAVRAGGKLGVRLTLADGRVYPTEGMVDYVAPELDPVTGTITVRGTVPNPDLKLKPGMFVRASVTGVERPGAMLVPQRSVVQSPAGAFVYVVDAGGKVSARPVVLGDWAGDDWVIRSGVSGGERVVTEGVQKVRPGMTVRVVVAGAATRSVEGGK